MSDSDKLNGAEARTSFQILPISPQEVQVIKNHSLDRPIFDPDWDPKNISSLSHIRSNERGNHYFKSVIAPPEGMKSEGFYLGLGAEQNYHLMAYSKPEFALLIDHDPAVVAMHAIHRVAFLHADSTDDFIAFYDDEHAEDSLNLLEREYSDDPNLSDFAMRIMKDHTTRTVQHGRFTIMKKTPEGHRYPFKDTFLSNEKDYQFVRDMFRTKRVMLSMGDLFSEDFVYSLGSLIKDLETHLENFYTSNAPDYQSDLFIDVLKRIQEFPIDDRSRLLLTTQTFNAIRRVGGSWNIAGKDTWSYLHMPICDLKTT